MFSKLTSLTIRRQLSTSKLVLRRSAAANMGLIFVPTKEAYVIELFGKYTKICDPGINFLIPFVHKVAYKQLLKEQAIDIQSQQAITLDNVVLNINGVLYIQVIDPYKASYGVEDPESAITQLAQTSMRATIGSMSLDNVFKEREALNFKIVEVLNNASEEPWGIKCLRYEIKDIEPPRAIQTAMEKEVEAERTKRATILDSEALRQSAINQADGEREAVIRKATAEAEAIKLVADAHAQRITVIGSALNTESGGEAASLAIAEKYIEAYSKLAQESTTLILPKDTDNVASSVATALQTFKTINNHRIGAKDVNAVLDSEITDFGKLAGISNK